MSQLLPRQALYLAWLHPSTVLMRSFWFDPYLWLHLAGLAAFPLFLEVCLIGLAMGDPLLPVWLELLLVAVVGIAPILWMQWQRPFYIFSLVAVTVKPEKLTDDQRRLLALFKSQRNRFLAALVSVVLMLLLWKTYAIAPIATPAIAFLPEWHWLGLLLASVAFLACNLFIQVPVSVASVMLTSESAFSATPPYLLESIRRNFTLVGLQLNRLLPPIRPDMKPDLATAIPTATPAMIASVPAPLITDPLANDLWADETTPAIEAPTVDSTAETSFVSDEATLSNPQGLEPEKPDS